MLLKLTKYTVASVSITLTCLALAGVAALADDAALEAAPAASPASAPEAKPVRLAIYPPTVLLNHATDYQNMIVVATRADGVTRDVTSEVEWKVEQPGGGETQVVKLDGACLKVGTNGIASLKVKYQEMVAHCDVEVKTADLQKPISFRHDVIPILTRTGCNAGACHGASRGKDGFRLSLFGFDPKSDYTRLTREITARRINLALPDDSLLLEKSIASVPHSGGKRFEADSLYYQELRKWIDEDVPNDLEKAPKVTGLEIYPPNAVLEGEASKQQFVSVATYSDGSTRDVTNLTIFSSNNEVSAAIDSSGMVQSGARGEAFVMARFDTYTVGSQVLVLPKDVKYNPPQLKPANYIDELVDKKLATLRLESSGIASDEEFLRRVTIDIVGKLPTTEEVKQFVASTDADKRAQKIDELLQRDEFSQVWAQKWADLLMVRSLPNRVEYKPMFNYSKWLEQQIADEVPIDKMVSSIISANGSSFTSPQVNFYQIEPDTQKIAENVAQAFMGIRIQCAQCHNHPFDRWTMDDYYGFAAFFRQIGRKQGDDYREVFVFNSGGGEVRHPVDNRVVKPKFLGGDEPDTQGRDRREIAAEWITSPENEFFAPSIANRVWAHFLGAGIIDPVDDIRVSNPPSNPELLQTLGDKLIEYNYDLRQMVRDICNSNTYQRTMLTNESNKTDRANFARFHPRRMPAETLLDCLCQVTDVPEKFRGLPLGARAVEIADGNTSTYFLTTFGRASRQSVCACEVKQEPTLSQALHLLNGNTVQGKVNRGKLAENMLNEGKSPQEVVDEIYLRSLGRMPTDDERQKIAAVLGDKKKPVRELNDLFWAVLNSREFLFNH